MKCGLSEMSGLLGGMSENATEAESAALVAGLPRSCRTCMTLRMVACQDSSACNPLFDCAMSSEGTCTHARAHTHK